MTVPSREEVARKHAEAWWQDLNSDTWWSSAAQLLDAQARAGFPALIGTTHEGCETCEGAEFLCDQNDNISGPTRCVSQVCKFNRRPCPDGRPAYWTVTE